MSTMYDEHIDPEVAFKALATDGGTDLFAWDNPVWSRAGVVMSLQGYLPSSLLVSPSWHLPDRRFHPRR